jgi:hypothetical protein
VDGEGTVTLSRHRRNQTPTPNVSVANNNLMLLKWIRLNVGGTIVLKRKRLPHHSDSYVWSIRQDRAIRFLKEIRRYLIVRKQQADLITREYKTVTHRAGEYTPEMLKKKNALVDKIRKLNQR